MQLRTLILAAAATPAAAIRASHGGASRNSGRASSAPSGRSACWPFLLANIAVLLLASYMPALSLTLPAFFHR